MRIVIPLFDRFTALDAVGPYEVLSRLPGAEVVFVATEPGPVRADAGVSSGIDMALTLAARLAGEEVARAIQLAIEYDPQPPFDSGSLAKADPAIATLARAGLERAAASPE